MCRFNKNVILRCDNLMNFTKDIGAMLIAIFRQFFLLGCMSFGGPAAHLGYFKRHFVDSLNWLTNTRYQGQALAKLVLLLVLSVQEYWVV